MSVLIKWGGAVGVWVEPLTVEVVAQSFVSSTGTSVDGGNANTLSGVSVGVSPDVVSTNVLNTPFSQDTGVLWADTWKDFGCFEWDVLVDLDLGDLSEVGDGFDDLSGGFLHEDLVGDGESPNLLLVEGSLFSEEAQDSSLDWFSLGLEFSNDGLVAGFGGDEAAGVEALEVSWAIEGDEDFNGARFGKGSCNLSGDLGRGWGSQRRRGEEDDEEQGGELGHG